MEPHTQGGLIEGTSLDVQSKNFASPIGTSFLPTEVLARVRRDDSLFFGTRPAASRAAAQPMQHFNSVNTSEGEILATLSLKERALQYLSGKKVRRHVGALVLTAAVISPSLGAPESSPMTTTESTVDGDDYAETRADAFTRIDAAFADDFCTPKLTAQIVKDTYDAIYPANDIRKLSDKDLVNQAYHSYSSLLKAQKQLTFVSPPKILDKLINDNASPSPEIPTSTYVETLSEYLDEFGQTAVYDWTDASGTSPQEKGYYSKRIEPTNFDQPEWGPAIRTHAVNIIGRLAHMPTSMPKKAATNVVFGDILDDSIGGQTLLQDEIYIDVPSVSDTQEPPNRIRLSQDVYEHELGHNILSKPCNGQYDTPFANLNGSLRYAGDRSKTTVSLLSQGVTSIEAKNEFGASGEVVTAEGYGWTDGFEDQATSFGEKVLNPVASPILMEWAPKSPVLNAKVAAGVSRLGDGPEKHLYESQLNSSVYVSVITDRIAELDAALVSLKSDNELGTPHYNQLLARLGMLREAAGTYRIVVDRPNQVTVFTQDYSAELLLKTLDIDTTVASYEAQSPQVPATQR